MKLLKRILVVLLVLVALVLVIALFLPKEYKVERTVLIDRPKQEVFDYLVLLKNQDNFSKWAKMDPDMKKYYRGTDGKVGFVSGWKSDKEDVGAGEQEIKGIVENEQIDYEIRFKEPYESKADAHMTTERFSDSKTRVKWSFEGKMPWPWNFMCLFKSMDEMVGGDLQTGLDNLKGELEKGE